VFDDQWQEITRATPDTNYELKRIGGGWKMAQFIEVSGYKFEGRGFDF